MCHPVFRQNVLINYRTAQKYGLRQDRLSSPHTRKNPCYKWSTQIMFLGKLKQITISLATVTIMLVGCSVPEETETSRKNQSEVEDIQPYEKISAGMNLSQVKELAGDPTDSWEEEGGYVVWYYYRFPIQEIAQSGTTDNLKGGSFLVTFLDGKVEEVNLLESDIKVYDNR